MDKPRLCEILGVEVGQKFTVKGYLEPVKAFWITEDGIFETEPAKFPGTTIAILRAIQNPDLVVKQPHFTADEMAVLRMMKRAGIKAVKRWNAGKMIVKDKKMEGSIMVNLLPSLEAGTGLVLDEMDLEGKE